MHSASKPALAGAWILLLLLATSAPAWAQYKWKDSRGQVHVSDLPPPRDIPDKDVLQRPATGQRSANTAVAVPGASVNASTRASASAAPPIRPPVDPELEARRKRADEEAKQRMRTDEERLENSGVNGAVEGETDDAGTEPAAGTLDARCPGAVGVVAHRGRRITSAGVPLHSLEVVDDAPGHRGDAVGSAEHSHIADHEQKT